jgi:hypothetical protein
MFAASWHGPMVALAIVEMMIDVPVEMIRPVVPRTSPDEYPTSEPLGPIVAIRSATVRRSLVTSVRTNRRYSYTYCNLCRNIIYCRQKKARSNHKTQLVMFS